MLEKSVIDEKEGKEIALPPNYISFCTAGINTGVSNAQLINNVSTWSVQESVGSDLPSSSNSILSLQTIEDAAATPLPKYVNTDLLNCSTLSPYTPPRVGAPVEDAHRIAHDISTKYKEPGRRLSTVRFNVPDRVTRPKCLTCKRVTCICHILDPRIKEFRGYKDNLRIKRA